MANEGVRLLLVCWLVGLLNLVWMPGGLHIQVQNFTDRRVEWALVSKLPPVSGQPEDDESK